MRKRSETWAPETGRPAGSESRTAYASPPPSDIGTGLRVTSAWGSVATRVPFAGGSTVLGPGTAFGGAAALGPESPRVELPASRGRSSGLCGRTPRGDARTAGFGEGVAATGGAGVGRGASAIRGAAGRARLRRVCTGGERTSRTRIALSSPAKISPRRSRAVRWRLNPRMRSSSRASASLRARCSIGDVDGTRGDFRPPGIVGRGICVGTMANPSRSSAWSTSGWWRRSMGGWCVGGPTPRRSMMISSSSPGLRAVVRAATDAPDNSRSRETMHRRLDAPPDAARDPTSSRRTGSRSFIRHHGGDSLGERGGRPMNELAPRGHHSAVIRGSHEFSSLFGRDVLSRVIYGARVSLYVAVTSVGLAMLVGGALGLTAGYAGGVWDNAINRVMDVFFSIPGLLLAVGVAAMRGPGVNSAVVAITIVYTPLFARVMRGPVLAEREKEYIEAVRALGAGRLVVAIKHLLPNVLSPFVVQGTVAFSQAILIEASLSYLGLSAQPPTPSWGNMLNEGRTYLETAPWISVFPGVAIMIAVLAFNLIGDGLRDILDPNAS